VADWEEIVLAARRAAWTANGYARNAARIALREGTLRSPRTALGAEERLAFVVGSPRSGTSFTGVALGSQPGFVDLGEVQPLKAVVPTLASRPPAEQAETVRRILQRVRTLGLARGLRGVEQNPETSFVLAAALAAYPQATAVHVIRDGRDVVCSLLERGWLRSDHPHRDDARLRYGAHARFWVEPERRDEFSRVSEARRAAWAWRRYVAAARVMPERTIEIRYEELVAGPATQADRVAERLDAPSAPLRLAFAEAHDSSVGRWRRDLTADQVADVEAEAGPLLAELGYLT
jgi:hypothetical protein